MNSDFGERIKQARKQRGLTQTTLANLLGVTKTMISAYETGIRKPSYENLMDLALFFDVSMDWMFGNTDDPTGVTTLDITQLNRHQRMTILDIIAEYKRLNKMEKLFLGDKKVTGRVDKSDDRNE